MSSHCSANIHAFFERSSSHDGSVPSRFKLVKSTSGKRSGKHATASRSRSGKHGFRSRVKLRPGIRSMFWMNSKGVFSRISFDIACACKLPASEIQHTASHLRRRLLRLCRLIRLLRLGVKLANRLGVKLANVLHLGVEVFDAPLQRSNLRQDVVALLARDQHLLQEDILGVRVII